MRATWRRRLARGAARDRIGWGLRLGGCITRGGRGRGAREGRERGACAVFQAKSENVTRVKNVHTQSTRIKITCSAPGKPRLVPNIAVESQERGRGGPGRGAGGKVFQAH